MKDINQKETQEDKLLPNIKYYGGYLGPNELDHLPEAYIRSLLDSFITRRKILLKRLREVQKIYNESMEKINKGVNIYDRHIMNDMTIHGLGYSYCSAYDPMRDYIDPENIILPLNHMNLEYDKLVMKTIDIELCYINRNIKAFKKALKIRKR